MVSVASVAFTSSLHQKCKNEIAEQNKKLQSKLHCKSQCNEHRQGIIFGPNKNTMNISYSTKADL